VPTHTPSVRSSRNLRGAAAAPPPQERSYAGPQDRGYQQGYDHRHDTRYGSQQQPYRKKKSFLSELFDD
jgi:Zn-finger nucleic acid-binding protein